MWQRHDLETMTKRLKALEARSRTVSCPFSEASTARRAFVWTPDPVGAVQRRARLIGLKLRNLRPTSFRSFESPGRRSYELQRHKMAIPASMRWRKSPTPCAEAAAVRVHLGTQRNFHCKISDARSMQEGFKPVHASILMQRGLGLSAGADAKGEPRRLAQVINRVVM